MPAAIGSPSPPLPSLPVPFSLAFSPTISVVLPVALFEASGPPGFFSGQRTTAATAPPTSTSPPRLRPRIRGRALAAFFGLPRRFAGRGRSSKSSSKSSSSTGGGGAALRGLVWILREGVSSSSSSGTRKLPSHFGQLIFFPRGRVAATLRPTPHEGHSSRLVS